jgi:DNA polymerase bacteriophage-type
VTHCFLDFETASELDLKVAGLDRYVKHPSTRVLMAAYALDDGPVHLWEAHKGKFPTEDTFGTWFDSTIVSWNVPFEYNILKHVLKIDVPLEQFKDAMVWARHLSLPGKLENAGPAIGLPHDKLKSAEGKRLIAKFCSPFHKGGEETLFGISEPRFHNWEDEPRDWALFGEYCKQDVVTEREIFKICSHIPLPESEQRAWLLDQKINQTGIPVNRKFVEKALALALKAKETLVRQLKEMTQLANPNSRDQFLGWATKQGYPYLSLGKNFVKAALAENIPSNLRTALELRQQASKTSYTKFETILNLLSDDDRLRHQFAFMGGARTGRWAGKDAQVQNLFRPDKNVEKNYARALELIENCPLPVTEEYMGLVRKEFPDVLAMVISCIRSSFQAPPGKKLVVCDLSSIENRVLGWLAGCDAIARVFREGRDAYLDFAARMYNVLYESMIKVVDGVHKAKNEDVGGQRQVAKPAVLGCGYGLGPGVRKLPDGTYEAVIQEDRYGNRVKTGLMGYAANMGIKLTPEQAYLAWQTFRQAYPEVVELWKKYERAVIQVLETGKAVKVGPIIFTRRKRKDGSFILRIQLPSGRGLHYLNARIEREIAVSKKDGQEYERKKFMYDGVGHGVGQIGKQSKWGPVYGYGGKDTENIDQGFSRDVLLHGMFLADEMGATIVLHAHDEIACEEEDDPFAFGLEDLKFCMETTPEWAPGLQLGAEGWEGKYYRK